MMYFPKISKLRMITNFRCFSVTSKKADISNVRKNLLNINDHNSIIISKSRDIYENLALEDWLYTNCDLSSTNSSILLMWHNWPAVVIGRHQNPWVECSVDFCTKNGIKIARRKSGGGTVYHDWGNLNLSFLTSRKDHNRKRNLELICESINRKWGVSLNISERHDILDDDEYKISGSAAKLGRTNAYHHCTLLVNLDRYKLKKALYRELDGVESKATSSIRANVINLDALCDDIDTTKVIEVVKNHYKQLYQVKDEHVFNIHPSERDFPGINLIQEELKSWEWCYGHTPRFTLTKSFQIEAENFTSSVEIVLNMNKGKLEKISLDPQIIKDESFEALKRFVINKPFSYRIHHAFTTWIYFVEDKELCRKVRQCILDMIFKIMDE